MCGGLVLVAGASSRGALVGQLGYHVGRGVGYITLGALAGAFGEIFIDTAKRALMPRSSLGGLIGLTIFLLLGGMAVLFTKRRGDRLVEISTGGRLQAVRERLAKVPFTLGLSTAVLPCPWLYSFVLLAAAAGSALLGIKVMTAFWLGTIPALIVVGTIFEAALRGLLRRYPLIQFLSIVAAFLFSIAAHMGHDHENPGGHHHDHSSHALH